MNQSSKSSIDASTLILDYDARGQTLALVPCEGWTSGGRWWSNPVEQWLQKYFFGGYWRKHEETLFSRTSGIYMFLAVLSFCLLFCSKFIVWCTSPGAYLSDKPGPKSLIKTWIVTKNSSDKSFGCPTLANGPSQKSRPLLPQDLALRWCRATTCPHLWGQRTPSDLRRRAWCRLWCGQL